MTKIGWRNYLIRLVVIAIVSGVIGLLKPEISQMQSVMYAVLILVPSGLIFERYLKNKRPQQVIREEQVNRDERNLFIRDRAAYYTLRIIAFLYAIFLMFGDAILSEGMKVYAYLALLAGGIIYFGNHYYITRNS